MKNILLLLLLIGAINSSMAQTKKAILYDDWSVTVTTNDRSAAPKSKKGDLTTNFVAVGTQWDHRIITYFFQNGTPDIVNDDERQSVRSAFTYWAAQTDLVFLEVCTAAQADIIVLWAAGNHGDGNNFDGVSPPGVVLAHGYFPPPTAAGAMAGDIHFDEDETWTNAVRNNDAQPIDLETVAAHEIGHSLGLNHTTVAGSLMLAVYTGSHRFLGSDDIAGVRSIYGAPSNDGSNFISGANPLCLNTTATYSIPNPPAGLVFSWSSSDPTVATINASTGVATSIKSGTVTFTATVSSGCGSVSLSRTITVGTPTPSITAQLVSGPGEPTDIEFTATAYTGINIMYNWYVNNVLYETTPDNVWRYYFQCRKTNTITCSLNSCNATSAKSNAITATGECIRTLSFSPNPATTELVIQEEAPTSSTTTAAPFEAQLYNGFGQMVANGRSQQGVLRLNVQHLSDGLYTLRAGAGAAALNEHIQITR